MHVRFSTNINLPLTLTSVPVDVIWLHLLDSNMAAMPQLQSWLSKSVCLMEFNGILHEFIKESKN